MPIRQGWVLFIILSLAHITRCRTKEDKHSEIRLKREGWGSRGCGERGLLTELQPAAFISQKSLVSINADVSSGPSGGTCRAGGWRKIGCASGYSRSLNLLSTRERELPSPSRLTSWPWAWFRQHRFYHMALPWGSFHSKTPSSYPSPSISSCINLFSGGPSHWQFFINKRAKYLSGWLHWYKKNWWFIQKWAWSY